MGSYKELIVWQKSFQLTLQIYQVTLLFPKEEIYTLTSQIRRSSLSIPSNIAEGHSRKTTKEYLSFLRIAFSSAAELETQLLLAHKLRYISEVRFKEINNLLTEILKLLNSIITTLKRKIG